MLLTPSNQLLLLQQRQTPSTFRAASVHVLLAHAVPYDIIVSEVAPPAADLGGFAKRYGVEAAEDLVGEFGGEGGEEVDLELFVDFAGNGGELGKAALGDNTLEHQLAVLRGGSRKERPHVCDGLLVLGCEAVEFLK